MNYNRNIFYLFYIYQHRAATYYLWVLYSLNLQYASIALESLLLERYKARSVRDSSSAAPVGAASSTSAPLASQRKLNCSAALNGGSPETS